MISKNKIIFIVLAFLFLLLFYFWYFTFFYNLSYNFIHWIINFFNAKNPLSLKRTLIIFLGNLLLPTIAAYGNSSLIFKFSPSHQNLFFLCVVSPLVSLVAVARGVYFLSHHVHVLPIDYLIFLLETIGIFIGIFISINFYFKLRNIENLKRETIKKIYLNNLNFKVYSIIVFIYALAAYIETHYIYTYIIKSHSF